MSEETNKEYSLNPLLESLLKYAAENYMQMPGHPDLWYRKIEDREKGTVMYDTDKGYTHKEVAGNWVEEVAPSMINPI